MIILCINFRSRIQISIRIHDHYLTEFPEIPPMVCGIWSGESKPILNEYIEQLVSELKILITEGISVNAHHISIKIGRILADTPARAFLKGNSIFT